MHLVGMMPVRNEDWVLGLSLRVALEWCDAVVVLLHACTDRSLDICMEIVREHPNRLLIVEDDNPTWDEMRHRQCMLELARGAGATHVAIIDADEVLTSDQLPTIRQTVEKIPPGHILQLALFNLRNGIYHCHADGLWGDRVVSVAFQDQPCLNWSGDKFHQREPGGQSLKPWRPAFRGKGGVMHLWGASEQRLLAKHALYKLTERTRWPSKPIRTIDAQYSQCVDGRSRWKFKDVPPAWWQSHLKWNRPPVLNVYADPWQKQEVKRLLAENPKLGAGLDLFGVANV